MSNNGKTINGAVYDHGDITIKFDSKEYTDIKELKYSVKRERGSFRGTSPVRRGRTRGTIDNEASLTMLKATFDQMVKDRGAGWMEQEFTVTAIYGNDDQPLCTAALTRCDIDSYEVSTSEGADAAEVAITLNVMGITENGVPPLKGMKL